MDITLHIMLLSGERIPVTIKSDETHPVDFIKREVFEKKGFPICQQKVLFTGKELLDGTVSDYGLYNNANVHLVLSLRGGMFHETSGKGYNYSVSSFKNNLN